MVVVAAVRACAFRVGIEIDANVEGAEAAGLFVAFTDGLELRFEVEILNVGEVAASEAGHAGNAAGTVGETFAHAGTSWDTEVAVVVELRVDGAGVGRGKVAAIAASGAGGVGSSGWVVR